MDSTLRPLTLGEILDRTAHLYRSNFLVFAGIFSIWSGVALVLNLVQIVIGMALKVAGGKFAFVSLGLGAVEAIASLLLLGAAVAAITRAVTWVHLGETASIQSAYKSTLPRFGRYLWLMTITGLLAWLPLGLLYGGYGAFILLYVRPRGLLKPGTAGADQAAALVFGLVTLGFGLLLLGAIAYALVMTLRYALALPACVVEDLPARQAIRRSIALSKGARGRIFVLFLLIGAIKLGLVGLSQAFFFVLIFKNHGQISPWVSAGSQVVAFFTNTLIGPIGATGIALFYYDQRVRKEGYDIEWMMEAAGLTPSAAGQALIPATPEGAYIALEPVMDAPAETGGQVGVDAAGEATTLQPQHAGPPDNAPADSEPS